MKIVNMDYSASAERIPGFLLWQVSKLWQRQLNAALSDLKLSGTQAIILGNVVRIQGQGKHATQTVLAQITKVDPMTMSQALRTLERKKMITRATARDDRRAVRVVATAKGIKTTALALERIIRAHVAFFQPLQGDLESLANSLETLIKSHDTADPNEE
jgi:DNA-binding MarR family transcriptional regulator